MLTFTWDSTYENSPTDQIPRNQLDGEFRRLKRRIADVMSREHRWRAGDGSHRPGITTVLSSGSDDDMNALTSSPNGSMFLRTDGSYPELFMVLNGSWEKVTELDHSKLDGLTDGDPHPQYLRKESDSEVFDGVLDAFGYKVHASSSQIVLGEHVNSGHDLGSELDIDLLADGAITPAKLIMNYSTVSGDQWASLSGEDDYQYYLSDSITILSNEVGLAPNLYVSDYTDAANSFLTPRGSGGYALAVKLGSFSVSSDYRIKLATLELE